MKIDFDIRKSDVNALERGLHFEICYDFDWDHAVYREDNRKIYPEQRFVAIGEIHSELHFICFTPIEGGVRIISLRRANRKERREYEQETADK